MSAALCLALGTALSVAAAPDQPPRDEKAQTSCDDACALRSQDRAFTLVTEAYREFRAYQIERQYEARLQQADHLDGDPGGLVIAAELSGLIQIRQWIRHLIEMERDLELRQLHGKVAQLRAAYQCSRVADERAVGESVPLDIDHIEAARKLQDLYRYYPGAVAASPPPATDILLDVPWYGPGPGLGSEACDSPFPPK